jgi:hypothetical protein
MPAAVQGPCFTTDRLMGGIVGCDHRGRTDRSGQCLAYSASADCAAAAFSGPADAQVGATRPRPAPPSPAGLSFERYLRGAIDSVWRLKGEALSRRAPQAPSWLLRAGLSFAATAALAVRCQGTATRGVFVFFIYF